MTKLYKTDMENFAVAWIKNVVQQTDKNGHIIQPNEIHAKIFEKTLKDGKVFWKIAYRLCIKCINKCELCNRMILKDAHNRFCSEGCGEEHYRRSCVESEDKEFWSE
jgi:hypothetical protein